MNIHLSYLNCCTTRRRSNTLKGSQRIWGGQIFLKTFHTSLFNEDLSNEPNFISLDNTIKLSRPIFRPYG
jgi:hypothetical protein